MSETRKIINKENKILNASAHVALILIMSLTIVFLIDELFHGSNIGKIVMLSLIASYIVFSFARRFWKEKKSKRLLDTIDITLTLVGGLFMIMVANKYNDADNVGAAAGVAGSQPHVLIFYLGILLLIAGAIRMYAVNKQQSVILKSE